VWFEAAVLWGTIASYSATNLGCTTRRSITVDPLYRTKLSARGFRARAPIRVMSSVRLRWRPEMQRRTIVPKCLCLVLRGRQYVAELSPGPIPPLKP
jgi:hypothetical protein